MFIHNISRVAFEVGPWGVPWTGVEVGPLAIRWYGLMFAGGVLLYYFLTRWLWKREKWPFEDFDSLILVLFIGLVVGARLGEVFFYNFGYYSRAGFWEIFKIWEGGLSSHGATIGLVVAGVAFWGWKRILARKAGSKARSSGLRRGFSFFKYADVLAVCMPLVAGFVRIGNFFNSEIVGRASDAPWAVVFAQNGESFGRHPAQLYEGLWAWAVFAVVFGLWLRKTRAGRRARGRAAKGWAKPGWARPGFFLFLFIGLYFAGRFVIEFFKEYQIGIGSDGLPWGMTMGQALSVVPVVVAVGWFIIFYRRSHAKS